jgi:hypothetical protein
MFYVVVLNYSFGFYHGSRSCLFSVCDMPEVQVASGFGI